MSLFPAYSNVTAQNNAENNQTEKSDTKVENSSEWLTNSSFQEPPPDFFKSAEINDDLENDTAAESPTPETSENVTNKTTVSASNNDDPQVSMSTKSHKKKKERKRKRLYPWEESSSPPKYERSVKNLYFEDIYRNKKFYPLETLPNTLKPRYHLCRLSLGFRSYKRKVRKLSRYYLINIDLEEKKKKKQTFLNISKETKPSTEEETKANDYENQQRSKTEDFNRKLDEDPSNVQMWIEFAKFQDNILVLPPFQSKRENLIRNASSKKLSIIEKGLKENPDSIELLKTKLQLMKELSPIDEFCSDLEELIKKNPRNIVLWDTLIFSIQTSCALCKVSRMLEVYPRCFEALRVKARSDPKYYDEQVLKILYQCLSFLRHAGLWELMCEIIHVNLCINLGVTYGQFKNTKEIEEKKLIELEEVILLSQLPLNQLWLRVETLRERSHWTSINLEEVDLDLIGDVKRIVSPDEMTDFIYPMYSIELNFRLSVYFILMLKVPLLPTRHSTMQDLALDQFNWIPDSLEYLLPILYSFNTTENPFSLNHLVTGLLDADLTAGPQLLKFHPAQGTFLEFVRNSFKIIADSLPVLQRISIFVWWLRFERLLVFVGKHDPIKDEKRNRKLKSIIKDFLKQPENRSNAYYYQEYALIERELGHYGSCIQILKTIIESRMCHYSIFEQKSAYCSLHRTLFECLLDSKTFKDENISTLLQMAKNLKKLMPNYPTVQEVLQKEITGFLENTIVDEGEKEFILPNYYCDLVACYAYFLYATNINKDELENFNHTMTVFEECINHCANCPRLKERFVETKMTFLQMYQQRPNKFVYPEIQSTLTALNEFPNNFLLLNANAVIECELPVWKMKLKTGKIDLWPAITICLAARSRLKYLEKLELHDTAKAVLNKLLSFHRTLAKAPEVQRCPLLWKLYMLLLREYNLCEKKGEDVYYEAASVCPWARNLYISAAEIAPQLLPQIQDILDEKELRVHVAPEELEILRG